jgi:hypothetical protein
MVIEEFLIVSKLYVPFMSTYFEHRKSPNNTRFYPVNDQQNFY